MADEHNDSDDQGLNIPTAVAIDSDKNSQYAVKWAVDNFRLKDNRIILLHVLTTPALHPNLYPQNAVPKQSLTPTQSEIHQMFLPYRGFCARKGVRVKDVIIHGLDIANTLCEYIKANFITTILLGASTRNAISRAFRNADVPSCVGKSAPDFCSVYVISKGGKALKIKSATELTTPTSTTSDDTLDSTFSPEFNRLGSWRTASPEKASSLNPSHDVVEYQHTAPWIRPPFSSKTTSSQSSEGSNELLPMATWEERYGCKNPIPGNSAATSFEYTSFGSSSTSPLNSVGFITEFGHTNTSPVNKKFVGSKNSLPDNNLLTQTKDNLRQASSGSSYQSEVYNFQSNASIEYIDHPRMSNSSRSSTNSSQAAEMEDELRRLKLELIQVAKKYNEACKEAAIAREKVREIDQWKLEEASKREGANNVQESALAMVEREEQKGNAAVMVVTKAPQLAELEFEKRRRAETKLKHEAEERQGAILACGVSRYRRYLIDEIEVATNYFSSSCKIGEGGYGPVYKAFLDHTPVAVKILKSDVLQGYKQFQREVEVLSRMRHPHMVILLGACPEYGCLVYEYMENGNLEDRLYRKNGTRTLPWRVRFRIAAEVGVALNFLHHTRPEPVVHRDLKPANILLDKNYVSKISDVGLSRMVPASSSQYHATAAAGTFCYIDPEYHQTGMLGTKSDIYSLGILLLQIITAKPAMGLTQHVQRAIETGRFSEILDPNVKDWPVEEALKFAEVALKCCELRRRDRPELDSVVLPELERLRDLE
ncbi:U-box domain-containing protein 35-like isoform X2 [Henckelia pumila]|uniref:U-box domain-containing protein 35-like isoform X2 n=1 Tax=Henckelia pumila TaxID=405737 RepID=UPI003C6E4F7B